MTNKERMKTTIDEMKVKGTHLVSNVKEVIEEGNARRVSIRKDGRTLMEVPLSVGVGGAAAAIFFTPVLAAVGALAALVTDVDVVVERVIAEVEVVDEDPKA
ncbi:MAG: DUF4342 domain-containing protein [Rhodothermales bacterium]